MHMEPCTTCDVRCCKICDIPLSVADVRRISSKHGLKPEEFVEKIPVNKTDSIFREIRSGREYNYMHLKKNEKGYCMFYKDCRCTIHDYKPKVCSIYPFTMESGKVVKRRKVMCKSEWGLKSMGRQELEALAQDFADFFSEFREHEKITRDWGANSGRPFDSFLKEITK